MASRVSFTQLRLEAELERYRAECQWDKIPAIIDQMNAARFHTDGEWFDFHLLSCEAAPSVWSLERSALRRSY